jgi:hypothetical protein
MSGVSDTKQKIDEKTLRLALRAHLTSVYKTPPIVAEEVSIDSWQRRIDVLAVFKTRTIAFEIKSDFDSMRRLPIQIEQDTRFFDRTILVTTKNMIEKVPNGLDLRSVGVWIATPRSCRIQFEKTSKSHFNYKKEKRDLAILLPKRNLARAMKSSGLSNVQTLTRAELMSNIDKISTKQLREEVIQFFRRRYNSNSE